MAPAHEDPFDSIWSTAVVQKVRNSNGLVRIATQCVGLVFALAVLVCVTKWNRSTVSINVQEKIGTSVGSVSEAVRPKPYSSREIVEFLDSNKASLHAGIESNPIASNTATKLSKLILISDLALKEANKFAHQARSKVKQSNYDWKQANELEKQSESVKRNFLAVEAPMESTAAETKLDERAYRSVQLLAAQDVVLVSGHPQDAKLRANLTSILERSKEDKKKLEADRRELQSLRSRTASATLDGKHGFTALRKEAVTDAAQADLTEKAASLLAGRSLRARDAASDIMHVVQSDILDLERSHRLARLARSPPVEVAVISKAKEAMYDRERVALEKTARAANSVQHLAIKRLAVTLPTEGTATAASRPSSGAEGAVSLAKAAEAAAAAEYKRTQSVATDEERVKS